MKKSDVKNVKDIENYYVNARKIRFPDDVEIKSLDDIIENLLIKARETVRLRGGHHCRHHRARSFDDYFLICKHYFPELTLKDYIKALYDRESIEYIEKKLVIYVRYCPTIRKTNTPGLFSNYGAKMGVRDGNIIDLGFPLDVTFDDILNT